MFFSTTIFLILLFEWTIEGGGGIIYRGGPRAAAPTVPAFIWPWYTQKLFPWKQEQNGGSRPTSKQVGACDGVTFVNRTEWGARDPIPGLKKIRVPVNMTFIHHAESGECTDMASCSKQARIIQDWAMDGRGWNDIGYSFLIGGDGRVYEGRGWDVEGGHTYRYNSVALGFSFIGNFTNKLPTKAAMLTGQNVLKCGVEKVYIKPKFETFGHRDGGYTTCPGNPIYREIQRWPSFSRRKITKY